MQAMGFPIWIAMVDDLPETNSRSEPFRRYGCSLDDFVLSMFAKWTVASDIDAFILLELLDVVKVRASYNFVLAAPIITTGVFDQESRNTCRYRFLVEFAKFHWDDPAGCDWRTSHGWSTPLCERPRRPKNEWWMWDIVVRLDMPWCVNARGCKGSKKLNVKLDKLKKIVCFPQSGLLFVKNLLRLGSQCYEAGQGANGFKQTCWLRDFRNGWLIWEAALAALAALAEIEMLLSAAVHSCVIGFAGSPDCGVDGIVWEVFWLTRVW